MPPKKKKASKKGGSRRESIAGSLGDQMKDLKRKLDESEMMLQEEQKVRERVGREKAGMLQQLASLEAALHQEQARHEEVVLRLERENARRSGLLTERIANLTNHRKELEQSLQSYALVESEHTRLCHVVNTLKEEVEAEVRLHTDEEKGLREDAFNMRMQLENVSRKTLRELDREYEKRAFSTMRDESAQADDENAKLCDELAVQSESVLTLMHDQDAMRNKLHDRSIERTMLQDTSALQASRIRSLERTHVHHESDIVAMQATITRLHAENKELEDRELRTAAGGHELAALEKRQQAAHRDANARKDAAVNLLRVLLAVSDGGALGETEARLAPPPRAHDHFDDGGGAVAAAPPTEYTSYDDAARPPEEDAAILRIWNSNYSATPW